MLQRAGARLLAGVGIRPGRALANARPTAGEVTIARADQLAHIRQRMESQLRLSALDDVPRGPGAPAEYRLFRPAVATTRQ